MLQGEEERDGETKTERQRETPGTERQGCGERSLISQHHLLPFPGLKAPLMSNLPQPHTSRAPQSHSSRLSPAPFLLLRTPICNSHPPTRILHRGTHTHTSAEINEAACCFLGHRGFKILLRKNKVEVFGRSAGKRIRLYTSSTGC